MQLNDVLEQNKPRCSESHGLNAAVGGGVGSTERHGVQALLSLHSPSIEKI